MTTHAEAAGAPPADLPVLFIADADPAARDGLEAALRRRFGADYQVLMADSAASGLDVLERLARQGDEVAIVAADHRLPDMDGVEFLDQARALHRNATRGLLCAIGRRGARIPWDDLPALQRATALGRIDFWALKAWNAPEELLYPTVQEELSAWTKANRPRHQVVRVVGEPRSSRTHDLRDALTRFTVPFGYFPADSDQGRRLLRDYGIDAARLPAVILYDGTVLQEPSLIDVAEALGVTTHQSTDVYDVAILGAGPAGLAASVYASSEGLRTLVLEPFAIGGQAAMSAIIRNYLGFPLGIGGGELAFRGWEQSLLFGAQFVYSQPATALATRGRNRVITLADGSEILARTVIIAPGVNFRRLGIPALDRLVGAGVFYGGAGAEAAALAGEEVYVVGGANSAAQAALQLARFAARVTLLVRGESLAPSMSDYLITQLGATPNVQVRLRSRVVDGLGESSVEGLVLEDIGTGQREEVAAAAVFVLIGGEPLTEWLDGVLRRDDNGFVLTGRDVLEKGWPLERLPFTFETSLPGVFAVGDARHGSTKRVAGAVGEGSVAVGAVHQYLADYAQGAADGN